ncbi:ribosome-binding factor A [cyanobacterium TDX16]|nr:ribosome-binding factor A [cyanobacterium TDX16]
MTRRHPTKRDYPRSARLNELIQRIVAEELERYDDERLDQVTVMAVEAEADLHTAVVYWADPTDGERDEEIGEAFEEIRYRLQKAINQQSRAKRTPQLSFRPDDTLRTADRVEQLLRDVAPDPGSPTDEADGVADEDDPLPSAAPTQEP